MVDAMTSYAEARARYDGYANRLAAEVGVAPSIEARRLGEMLGRSPRNRMNR